MLGQSITDKYGVEGEAEAISGMGLLPVVTEFEQSKRRTQIQGRVAELNGEYKALSGMRVTGYEIHMGKTFSVSDDAATTEAGMLLLEESEGIKTDGFVKDNVMGTYLHGIFDEEEFRTALLSVIFKRKGMDYNRESAFSYAEYKEQQFDKLAHTLRESLDMDMIYEIMGLNKR